MVRKKFEFFFSDDEDSDFIECRVKGGNKIL